MLYAKRIEGYIAQMCEVHLQTAIWKQYNKMAVLHFFLVNSPLIYIFYSLWLYSTNMWSTPAVWIQYNKMAVFNFFSSKFHSNIFSLVIWFSNLWKNVRFRPFPILLIIHEAVEDFSKAWLSGKSLTSSGNRFLNLGLNFRSNIILNMVKQFGCLMSIQPYTNMKQVDNLEKIRYFRRVYYAAEAAMFHFTFTAIFLFPGVVVSFLILDGYNNWMCV